MVIVIRWVSEDLQEHESFIGLYEVDSIDANCLAHSIKDVLLRLNVNISHCRGQYYDGASNMRGSRNCVATQIPSLERRDVYMHCFGHALNLAVADTLKQSRVCREALETAYEITKLTKYSPKRIAAFNRIKAEISDEDAITSILENYSVLSQLWEECLEARMKPDLKRRVIEVKTQLGSHQLLFGLKLSEKILRVTDNLSRTLQKTSLSAAEGRTLAKMTLETLMSMRTDKAFVLFLETVKRDCDRLDTDQPTLARKRKATKRFEVGEGDEYHSPTVHDSFRMIIMRLLILLLLASKNDLTSQDMQIYSNLESLLLKAAKQEDYSCELKEVLSFYKGDFNDKDLATQLEIFSTNYSSKDPICKKTVTLQDILSFVRTL